MTPPPSALLALTAALTALTAPTVAAAVPSEAPAAEATLDMSPESFDDRYRGCSGAMAAALPALNRSEQRGLFAQAWASAAAEWRVRAASASSPALPRGLAPSHAVALLAYTAPLPLHRAFNQAVRRPGDYRRDFPFKALHFLLSSALAALREAGGRRCHRVFRGLRGLRFRARRGDRVRLGGFASASRRNETARAFGTDTAFQVLTCHGAPIRDFSFFPHEDEVLIPPFETFEVTGVTGDSGDSGDTVTVTLTSVGTWSRYNCEWLRGQRCGDDPCVFDSGQSVTSSPPHLGGLLLATTALLVATRSS